MAGRDLFEAGFTRDCRRFPLVIRVFVAVHEDNGDGANAVIIGGLQGLSDFGLVEVLCNRSVIQNTSGNLCDTLVKKRRLDNFSIKQTRAGLIANLKGIGKARVGEQKNPIPFSFKQRIGRNSCAHFHRRDFFGWNSLALRNTDEVTNALDGRVGIGFRVFG